MKAKETMILLRNYLEKYKDGNICLKFEAVAKTDVGSLKNCDVADVVEIVFPVDKKVEIVIVAFRYMQNYLIKARERKRLLLSAVDGNSKYVSSVDAVVDFVKESWKLGNFV